MKKRLLSGLLALVLVLSLVPFGTLAEDVTTPDESVTETTEVTETMQVTEPAKATEPTKATEPVATTEPTDVTEATDATQATAAAETTEPTVPETTAPSVPTAVETVQSLIDALPETVTEENREEVEEKLTAIDDAKLPLTDEQRDMLDFGKYNAAIAALNELDDMAGAEVPLTMNIPTKETLRTGLAVSGSFNSWGLDPSVRMTETVPGSGILTATVTANSDGKYLFHTSGTWDCSWGQGSDNNLVRYSANYFQFPDERTYTLVVDINNYNETDGSGMTHTLLAQGAYVITLNSSGGTGAPAFVTTGTDGKLTTLPTPTKSGCAFLGWYNGETKWSTDSVATENITLTAKWSDGTNVESEEELKACIEAGIGNITLGENITLTEQLTIPSGNTITLNLNGHKLTSNLQYTVELNGNLTVSGSGTIENTYPKTDDKSGAAVHISSGTLILSSGSVIGSGDASDGVRMAGGIFTMNGGSVSGKARSVYIHKGAVMNANGGTTTGGLCNRGTIQTTSGTGTIFINGKAINDTSGNNWNGVVKGGNFENTNRDGIYKVTFLDGETTVATQYRGNACADVPDYGKEGYTVKWYDGDTQWDFSQKVTKDMILKTKFEATVTTEAQLKEALEAGITDIKLGADITLSGDLCITEKDWNLDLNGHTLSGGQIKFSTGKMTVTDSVGGGSVNNSIALTSATLSGTVFKGYVNCMMSTINGGAFYDRVNLMYGSDVQNGLFYAQDSFGTATTTGKQVVFKLNGSFLRMQVTTGTVTEPDVAKIGYTLTGWCRDAECKGDKWGFTQNVNEDMTLYGKSEITTYTITYDKGAEDATGTIEKGTKEYGKDFKLNVATYTRKGYIQVGWYDTENKRTYYGGDVYKENKNLYLTAIWEKEVSYTIPFTKTVKQAGSTKPGEATFSLYICGVEDIPDKSGTIDCNAKVTTKGTGNFTGTLTISGSQELVWAMLCSGIYVQEWDSEMDKWSYDDSIYFLRLNEGQDGYQLAAYAATAKTVDKATVYSCDSSKTVKMTFTNTYGTASKADTSNPKTGDTIYIAAATCLLSAMALIAILPRKKRM